MLKVTGGRKATPVDARCDLSKVDQWASSWRGWSSSFGTGTVVQRPWRRYQVAMIRDNTLFCVGVHVVAVGLGEKVKN